MAWESMSEAESGETAKASQFNTVVDNVRDMHDDMSGLRDRVSTLESSSATSDLPRFNATSRQGQSVSASSWTSVTLNNVDTDNMGGFTSGGTEYTVQKTGWYWVSGNVGWDKASSSKQADAFRSGCFNLDGSQVAGSGSYGFATTSGYAIASSSAVPMKLQEGQKVELSAFASEKTNLTKIKANACRLSLVYISED